MKIYIDNDYKCHVSNNGTLTAIETDAFDGKCDAFIEGFRFVPSGESWTRSDGVVFHGEMIAPWKPYNELAAAQAQHEEMLPQLQDMENALAILLGGETV